MALARRRFGRRLLLSLPYTLSVSARLPSTTLLAPFRGPIPTPRLPHRPTSCRITAALATIASQAMNRTKPSPAPLQQTHSRSAIRRALPSRPIAIMILNQGQGSCFSQRSSPGAEPSTPLRDASSSPTSSGLPPFQRNPNATTTPFEHLHARFRHLAPTSPPSTHDGNGPLAPAKWPPPKPPLTA